MEFNQENKNIHIAIFGPTGYIGTKLIRDLYNTGHKLTLFSRSTRKLDYLQTDCFLLKHNQPNICVIQQFLEEEYYDDIIANLQGVDVVYYLVHSLYINEKSSFLNRDNQLASLVAKTSAEAGVKQIIYLGGLGVDSKEAPISKHLLSRQDTANYLRKYHYNVTEFRAGVIIGAGSSSFEIIRSLGNKLPFLPKLAGIEGLCQPIFIDDVISYLIYAKLNTLYSDKIVEIGSKDVFTYSEMIREFALDIRNTELTVVPLPIINRLLTTSVLSYITSHMSNMPYLLIRRLLEGMNSYAIVSDYPVEKIDPNCPIKAKSFKESILIATQRLEEAMFQSVWSIPYELSVLNAEKKTQFLYLTSKELEGMLFEEYSAKIDVTEMESVFETIKTIGGERGYFSPRWLWEIRGFIDKLLNGRGLCPNPRDPRLLRVGDRIDFWVVSYYKNWRDHKVLRLKANMKTPGTAWLQFVIQSSKKRDSATFTLSAYFEPKGIAGYIYWYSLYFIHKFIFKYMVKDIIKESKKFKSL